MKTIFKLLYAIFILSNVTLNACEPVGESNAIEEVLLSSTDLVQYVIEDKIYLNVDKIDFNENAVEIQLDGMMSLHVPYLCVDQLGVFLSLNSVRGGDLYKCSKCGYLWIDYSFPWFCPQNGCPREYIKKKV